MSRIRSRAEGVLGTVVAAVVVVFVLTAEVVVPLYFAAWILTCGEIGPP